MTLPPSWFERPVLEVARDLLGATVAVGEVAVRLTEVEAYAGSTDPGSHAFRGRTPRTSTMFGAAGHLYVYFTYGMHHCANVVCGPDGVASAVLLRAGEVVAGVDTATLRRGGAPSRDLARGPARLATCLGLTRSADGLDLCSGGVASVVAAPSVPGEVRTGPRVGVSGPGGDGTAYPWRFWLDGEPTVSLYRAGRSRAR